MKRVLLLVVFMVLWGLISFTRLWAQSNDCENIWRQGIIGSDIGENSMHSGDFDNDGNMEIICAAGGVWQYHAFWYKLEYVPETQNYHQIWVSRYYDTSSEEITVIEVFDVDGDSLPDILVGFDGATIDVYNSATMKLKDKIKLPVTDMDYRITRMLFTDADNDGSQELVCCTKNTTYLLNNIGFGIKRKIAFGSDDMRCGNVDADSLVELIYSDGRVLRIEPGVQDPVMLWQFNTPSFYNRNCVLLQDIDDDGKEEILYSNGSLYIYDADIQSQKLKIELESDQIQGFHLIDLAENHEKRIVVGSNYDDVFFFDLNGVQTGELQNIANGVSEFIVDDFDNDSITELMWGTGNLSTESDYLCIYDLSAGEFEWISSAFEWPFSDVEIIDIDKDGKVEIITLMEEGVLTAFDAETHLRKWQISNIIPDLWDGARDFEISDIDNDNVNEIIIVCDQSYEASIWIIDGNTLEVESHHLFNEDISRFNELKIADLDNNGTKEIIAGNFYGVYIINPINYSIQWYSPKEENGNDSSDLLIGNIDNDANSEIIKLNFGHIICFDGITHDTLHVAGNRFSAICFYDIDKNGTNEIIAGTYDGDIGYVNVTNHNITWFPAKFDESIDGISVFDIPDTETSGFAVMSKGKLYFSDKFGNKFPPVTLSNYYTYFGLIKQSDYNNDGIKEIFVVTEEMISEYNAACYTTIGETEQVKTESFSIYPNPAENTIYLELNIDDAGSNAFVEIFSIYGTCLYTQKINNFKTSIDISYLPKGIYFIRLTANGLQSTAKVIKK
ncbi:MAG: T9SS type A sorting domain-containing protein [Bacteroidales bacterium]|nr:T9SS type A sorting domain-containing protein [Bacteroidales bacterium]